jgi:hypothetical protein
MISVIICSANQQMLKDIIKNINETIGVAFEILSFENSKGDYGICELYNRGAQQAKYEVLCYMHEDVAISTKDWGRLVSNILSSDSTIGLIGIAGSSYKTISPSGWFSGGSMKANYVNILQKYKFENRTAAINTNNPRSERMSQVAVIDGVWFCTKKSIVAEFPFDEQTFKYFHCYDIDFSLSVIKKYKAVVTYDFLLEHFSEGNYSQQWIEETLLLHKKWQGMLPINLEGFSVKEQIFAEKHTFRFFLAQMKLAGYSKRQMLNTLNKSKLNNVSWLLFFKMYIEILFK